MAALPVEPPTPPDDDPPALVDAGVVPLTTRAAATPSDMVAVRYRDALRAWYIAARAGGATREARLEESVRGVEDAAGSAEMPSLWYWLESARLLRTGDVAGAQTAYEAGMAPAPGPANPPEPREPLGAEAMTSDETIASARPLLLDRLAMVGYLVLMTIAEMVVTYGNPVTVFTLHGGSSRWRR